MGWHHLFPLTQRAFPTSSAPCLGIATGLQLVAAPQSAVANLVLLESGPDFDLGWRGVNPRLASAEPIQALQSCERDKSPLPSLPSARAQTLGEPESIYTPSLVNLYMNLTTVSLG